MMSAGCALVSLSRGHNDLSSYYYTIQRAACGLTVECGDADGLEVALRRFLDQPEFLAQCRANAHSAAEVYYSSEVCLHQYELTFRRITEVLA